MVPMYAMYMYIYMYMHTNGPHTLYAMYTNGPHLCYVHMYTNGRHVCYSQPDTLLTEACKYRVIWLARS